MLSGFRTPPRTMSPCVVVGSRSSSGEHLLDPRLCVCQGSTRTRDSGQGRGLTDRLGTFTRLTRVARLTPVSHISVSCELPRFTCGQLLLRCKVALVPTRSSLTPSETCLSISLIQAFTLLERLFVCDIRDYGDVICVVSVEHVRRDLELATAVSHCLKLVPRHTCRCRCLSSYPRCSS